MNIREEEFWNVVTHGLGFIFSLVGFFLLVFESSKKGDTLTFISVSIYGMSMVILYLASTVYHSVSSEKQKLIFRKLDHLCIYILIAGTYTPVALLGLKGAWGWSIFGSIWGLALVGFVFKFSPVQKSEKLSLLLYAAMGWLIVVALKPLLSNLSTEALIYMAIGGFFYTSGIYFYANSKIPFNHAIWHVFVLAGSTFHFFGIYWYILT